MNHYIELDQSKSGDKYLVVHSGSRNLGVQIAKHYQELAISNLSGLNKYKNLSKSLIEIYKINGWEKEISNALEVLKTSLQNSQINNDLAYLDGQYLQYYLKDMNIAQQFAATNRAYILFLIAEQMGWLDSVIGTIESIHNYIDIDNKIIRKGAISAKEGEKVIIPLNMRDGVIIGIGKGNSDWNFSAPHGAGRLMSRSKARENIKLEDFQKTMEGIYTTSVSEFTIDESPFAYKPAQEIIDKIKDTVEITEILKPIYNFKANN